MQQHFKGAPISGPLIRKKLFNSSLFFILTEILELSKLALVGFTNSVADMV